VIAVCGFVDRTHHCSHEHGIAHNGLKSARARRQYHQPGSVPPQYEINGLGLGFGFISSLASPMGVAERHPPLFLCLIRIHRRLSIRVVALLQFEPVFLETKDRVDNKNAKKKCVLLAQGEGGHGGHPKLAQ
jgi:hypothetical protein